MQNQDAVYLELLSKLTSKLEEAKLDDTLRLDRTGVGTVSLFGYQMRFNLAEGFPILTTKKVHFPSVVSELLWFLKGDTNIKYLLEHNNHIWSDWRYKKYLEDFSKGVTLLPYTIVAKRENDSYRALTKEEFEEHILRFPILAECYGDIGKGYGHQWRNFGEVIKPAGTGVTPYPEAVLKGFDQISWVINEIKTNPTSRRLIVSGWNPHDVDQVDLPPCHTLFQFFVEELSFKERYKLLEAKAIKDNLIFSARVRSEEEWLDICDTHSIPKAKLSCQLYQRSADVFLGVPFNIASYALLTNIIAKECNLGLGEFIWTGGDVHLYSNHLDQAKEQCLRSYDFDTPKLKPFALKPFDQYEPSDFELIDYKHHPAIKAPVAV